MCWSIMPDLDWAVFFEDLTQDEIRLGKWKLISSALQKCLPVRFWPLMRQHSKGMIHQIFPSIAGINRNARRLAPTSSSKMGLGRVFSGEFYIMKFPASVSRWFWSSPALIPHQDFPWECQLWEKNCADPKKPLLWFQPSGLKTFVETHMPHIPKRIRKMWPRSLNALSWTLIPNYDNASRFLVMVSASRIRPEYYRPGHYIITFFRKVHLSWKQTGNQRPV